MTKATQEGRARIHKIMAERGLASRRHCERLIAAGRVRVNSQVASIGMVVGNNARISVDGRPLLAAKGIATQVLLFNKRVGELCSRRPMEGKPIVFDALPRPRGGRWIMVGRLDINTAGLLLFTNNGLLAHKLMHPGSNISRVYLARVAGQLDANTRQLLLQGVQLEDGQARFDTLADHNDADNDSFNSWYQLSVSSGRNRMVRRLFASQGLQVSRLMRIAYGPQKLDQRLQYPRWRLLSASEIRALQQAAGVAPVYHQDRAKKYADKAPGQRRR